MNRVWKRALSGSTLAFGLALTPTTAQHAGHGNDRGIHEHAQKGAAVYPFPNCPVTDEPINLAVSVDTNDGPVFFCCEGCISRYQASPSKYAGKIAGQRRTLAKRPKIQVTCPVSTDPVDQDIFVDKSGHKVFFCCKGCINKYEKNPAKYASALANSYTYQTKCPVMGEDIDPKAFTATVNGKRFYFCCKGCDKRFFEDPKKYAPNLGAQGFTVRAKAMSHDASDRSVHNHGSHDHGRHDD